MKNVIVFVVLGLALSGCMSCGWNKPNATTQEFNQDRYSCMKEAQQRVSGARVDAYSGQASSSVIVDPYMMQACLEAQGYQWQCR